MHSLRFVFKYIKIYKFPLALTVGSMTLLVGIQLLAPWLIKTMISTVTDPTAGLQSISIVSRLALIALLIYILRAGMQFVRSYMAHKAGWFIVADIRAEVYEHLQRLSLRFYDDKQTGQLMSRTVNDSEQIEKLISHAIPDILVNLLLLVGVTVVLFSMSWQLALLSMIPIPLIAVAMQGFKVGASCFPPAPGRAR